jgi:hypothetical protein
VQFQIQAAVDKAVRESEARQSEKTQKMMADFLKQTASDEASIRYLSNHVQAEAVDAYRQSSMGGAQ